MSNKLTKILIFLTILLIPTYLIRLTILGIPTNLLEILVLANFISSLLSKQKFNYRKFYGQNKIYLFGVVLIFAGLLVSTLVNENYRAGFGIIKSWFIVPLIFSWVLVREIKNKENTESVIKCLYLGIFWASAVSLAYYFQGNLTFDGRIKVFYLSPNHLAMYLAPGVIIGLYLIQNSKIKNNRIMFLITNLVIIIALYLTYSYAAWIAIIFSFGFLYLIKERSFSRKGRIILVIIILLAVLFVSQANNKKMENLKNFSRSSLESRIIIWKSAGRILSDNPIWGIGPGNFQNKYLEYQKHFPPYLEWAVPQPHNLYLAFWLNAGILGLAGFLILIINWLKKLIGVVKKQKNGAIQIAAIMLGIMLYVLIHGLADAPYWKNDLALVFWIAFSLGIIIQKSNVDPV